MTATTAERLRVDWHDPNPQQLARAGAMLRAGGLVAFPTETVYGLGANALDGDAVRRIFTAKGRPVDNPLIVHLADLGDLGRVARAVTSAARRLAERWWPGPLTIVVEATVALPAVTTGGLETVAVRVPDHPVALGLLQAAAVPVAAPSANRSGRPSPTTAEHVLADIGDAVDLVLDGGSCRVGVESTVVDARGDIPVVLREGAITREQLGISEQAPTSGSGAPSPGTRYRHYAPDCRVEIAPPNQAAQRAALCARTGRRTGLIAPVGTAAPAGVLPLVSFEDPADLARLLYRALRDAESAGLDIVVCAAVPESGIGRAVMDRLRRAAAAG